MFAEINESSKHNSSVALVRAPDWGPSAEYVNCARAYSLQELRGYVVVLDFWTSSCINCLHTASVLQKLEVIFQNEPVVFIGIHSGKFPFEKSTENIREAIQRMGVRHPVINDSDLRIWQEYAIRAWPSLVVIRPDGKIAFQEMGEPDAKLLEVQIQRELDTAEKQGLLSTGTFYHLGKLAPNESYLSSPQNLSIWPGAIPSLSDAPYHLVISDTAHHRLLIARPNGQTILTIGSGKPELADGSFEDCAFSSPQGTCPHRESLLVADAGNHAIRQIDFLTAQVKTLAGTGQLAQTRFTGLHPAFTTALRSPWSVQSTGEDVFIALAGSHQIGLLQPEKNLLEFFAGTGEEGLVDGALDTSLWAQPSALVWDDVNALVYIVDSESSSVRRLNPISGLVDTLVGSGLFSFGDHDAEWAHALLQHPMGLAYQSGFIYIADTYNGKIKRLNLLLETCETVLDNLHSPQAIAFSPDGRLWIVETGANRIVSWSGATTPSQDTAPIPLAFPPG